MGTYPLERLIHEWGRGTLTEEQAIGQVLLLIQEVRKQLGEIESKLACLERALYKLPASTECDLNAKKVGMQHAASLQG